MTNLNWRDASKELPENNDICLVVNELDYIFSAWFDDIDDCWDSSDCVGLDDKITHWIPIREIPLPEE